MDETETKNINIKRLLTTTGLVIFTAIIVGGSVWYTMNWQENNITEENKKQTEKLLQEIEDLKKLNANSTDDLVSTSSLKTYTNTNHGFSYQYPVSGGYIADGRDTAYTEIPDALFTGGLTLESKKNMYEYPGELTINVYKANGTTLIEDWLKAASTDSGDNDVSYINPRENSLKTVTDKGEFTHFFWSEGMASYSAYATIRNNKVYIVSTINENEVFMNVLKSFKFF